MPTPVSTLETMNSGSVAPPAEPNLTPTVLAAATRESANTAGRLSTTRVDTRVNTAARMSMSDSAVVEARYITKTLSAPCPPPVGPPTRMLLLYDSQIHA